MELKDAFGKWRTYSLFWEHRQDGYEPLWVLKEESKHGLPSLKEIYMSYPHVPGYEYDFANNEIGSWAHWQRLCRSGIKQHIEEWRAELDVKLRAEALKSVIAVSKDETATNRLQASRYLADKGYAPVRGRPSKEEKAGLLKEEARIDRELEDDLERVGLKVAK